MRIIKMSQIDPEFPLTFTCQQCKSVLEITEKDLHVRETFGEGQFCGVDCPVCGVIGIAPVSEAYAGKFISERDLVGNLLSYVFSFGGLLK
jgi:hypothetical protein